MEGGIITNEDLQEYAPVWAPAVSVKLDSLGVTVHSVPPPGSGAIMEYILNILGNYHMKPEDTSPLLYHRVTEAFKWAYALRTEIGDPLGDDEIHDYVNQVCDHVW